MAYWYKSCLRCKQGRLFIMRFVDDGGLYLHCEECEWIWPHPNKINLIAAGTLGIAYESVPARISEIETSNWSEFANHEEKM